MFKILKNIGWGSESGIFGNGAEKMSLIYCFNEFYKDYCFVIKSGQYGDYFSDY